MVIVERTQLRSNGAVAGFPLKKGFVGEVSRFDSWQSVATSP